MSSHHNPRPFGEGPRLATHAVTREQLRRWGFPCRDCPTGHGVVTSGPDFGKARHAAVAAGWLESDPVAPEVVKAWHADKAAARNASNLAAAREMAEWVADQKRQALQEA